MIDPQITEICRHFKITDYLHQRGVEVIKTGNRWRCLCPLPSHQDHDPSFYIMTTSDGAEIFKCFGCGKSGGIAGLMAEIEGLKKGNVIKRLASQAGITLAKFDPSVKIEPLPHEVLSMFCDEQDLMSDISTLTMQFMHAHPSEDVVNKIGRMYAMLDKMTRLGDGDGMRKCLKIFCQTIAQYE